MRGFQKKHLLAIALLASFLTVTAQAATTINVPADQPTIEAAIAFASSGDIIEVADGLYNPVGTLTINKALTINGQSEGGVVINIPAAGGYGMSVNASNVTLSNFTLVTNSANENFPIHASGTTNPPNGWDYLTIQNVTINGAHRRTGFDVHGYNNVVLSHLTSSDATGGNGLQVTGCVGVTIDNITTSGNAWGSIAIYCSKPTYLNRGSSGVAIDGDTCSLAEQNLYNQDEFGLFNTGITVTGYDYLVRNAAVVGYDWYQDTLADAKVFALAAEGGAPGNYIETIAGGTFTVPDGLTIQAAVEAAAPGDFVGVETGLFPEQVHITKNLTIQGAGTDLTVIQSPATLPLFFTTSNDKYSVVFVDGASSVDMSLLTVDGAGLGNANNSFVGVGFWNGGGSLADAKVTNIMDTPFSGSQHGVGVYAANDTSGPYTIAMTNVLVDNFQKTAVALTGAGLTVALDNVSTPGAGPTSVTAQNGIQVSYGATGSVANCNISGMDYTGATWTASGMILDNCVGFDVDNVTLTGCQTSAYIIDASGNFDNCTVTAPTGDAMYVYSTGAKSGAAPRRLAQPFDPMVNKSADKVAASVSIDGGTFIGTGATDSWGPTAYGYGPGTFTLTNSEVANWDWGVVNYDFGGATFNTNVHGCNIHGNTSYGFFTNATVAADATCNWWGDIGGPDYAPFNPNPSGDAVTDFTSFAPWLDSVGGTCGQYGNNNIGAAPTGEISACNTCLTVPVEFNRLDTSLLRGVSVTFELSSELELCSGTSSIKLATGTGSLYDGFTNTQFFVVDNGAGSYTADATLLGTPCGVTAGGIVFTVDVTNAAGITTDTTGMITVTSVTVRDCANAPLPGIPGPAGTVIINNGAPGVVTNLSAAQLKTGNDTNGTTKINLTWTDPVNPDLATIEIYRKGFGDYPEYDDGTGAVPTAPATPAAALLAGWSSAASVAAGVGAYSDEPTNRDFWYYVAFANDGCNDGGVSGMTDGTLNYHLGDVVSLLVPADPGENLVDTADISRLGNHYGINLVFGDAFNYLDVGPTTDYSVDARPTTDNKVQFEDLMMFAINYGQVAKSFGHPVAAAVNALALEVTANDGSGGTFEATLTMSGDGQVQGLSAPLAWNSSVVRPVGMVPGEIMAAQGGQNFVAAPELGTVDAALFGIRDSGICGTGVLATVRFERVGPGDPGIGLGDVAARDAENKAVTIDGSIHGGEVGGVPTMSVLNANIPNPFNPTTTFSFVLATSGHVNLSVYTLRGQLVSTLVDGNLGTGPHSVEWSGIDDSGRRASSGIYLVRMVAPDRIQNRRITLVK